MYSTLQELYAAAFKQPDSACGGAVLRFCVAALAFGVAYMVVQNVVLLPLLRGVAHLMWSYAGQAGSASALSWSTIWGAFVSEGIAKTTKQSPILAQMLATLYGGVFFVYFQVTQIAAFGEAVGLGGAELAVKEISKPRLGISDTLGLITASTMFLRNASNALSSIKSLAYSLLSFFGEIADALCALARGEKAGSTVRGLHGAAGDEVVAAMWGPDAAAALAAAVKGLSKAERMNIDKKCANETSRKLEATAKALGLEDVTDLNKQLLKDIRKVHVFAHNAAVPRKSARRSPRKSRVSKTATSPRRRMSPARAKRKA